VIVDAYEDVVTIYVSELPLNELVSVVTAPISSLRSSIAPTISCH